VTRQTMVTTRQDQHAGLGVIEPGVLYLAEGARRRLRMGASAWRSVRRAGLQIVYVARNAYVFGDDLIAFFRRVQSSRLSAGGGTEAHQKGAVT
jgi:hypothetical protein